MDCKGKVSCRKSINKWHTLLQLSQITGEVLDLIPVQKYSAVISVHAGKVINFNYVSEVILKVWKWKMGSNQDHYFLNT